MFVLARTQADSITLTEYNRIRSSYMGDERKLSLSSSLEDDNESHTDSILHKLGK